MNEREKKRVEALAKRAGVGVAWLETSALVRDRESAVEMWQDLASNFAGSPPLKEEWEAAFDLIVRGTDHELAIAAWSYQKANHVEDSNRCCGCGTQVEDELADLCSGRNLPICPSCRDEADECNSCSAVSCKVCLPILFSLRCPDCDRGHHAPCWRALQCSNCGLFSCIDCSNTSIPICEGCDLNHVCQSCGVMTVGGDTLEEGVCSECDVVGPAVGLLEEYLRSRILTEKVVRAALRLRSSMIERVRLRRDELDDYLSPYHKLTNEILKRAVEEGREHQGLIRSEIDRLARNARRYVTRRLATMAEPLERS